MTTPIKLVLDTNVVLDWLLFEHVSTDVLRQGTQEKWIRVITYAPALEELRRVLSYPQFKLDAASQAGLLERYRTQTSVPSLPEAYSPGHLMLPEGFPRCRDPDDDHFLAFAHHAGADALVSKDKAVLKLRRRARKFGLRILDVPQLIEVGGWARQAAAREPDLPIPPA